MVIELIEELTIEDFYKSLIEEPKEIRIINISDIQTNADDSSSYFYIDYELVATGQEIGVSYNVKLKDDAIIFGVKSKFYPIFSHATNLENPYKKDVSCSKDDIMKHY